MEKLLFAAGTAFLRAFGMGFLVYVTGILAAPNLATARTLSIAALLASIAAGFRAIQVFVPAISFETLGAKQPFAAWADSFTRAFLASFLITITGWLATPDLSTWRSVGLAAIVGALTAGVRAIQGLLSPSESPAAGKGLAV